MLPHAYSDLDERDTVPGILARRAAETPDRRWLTDILAGQSITFGEGHDLVLRWADALRRLGVTEGDRVGVMLPNSFDAVAAWLGTGWVRGYEVPLNTGFRGELLSYFLTYSGMSVAVVSERFVPVSCDLCGLGGLANSARPVCPGCAGAGGGARPAPVTSCVGHVIG